MSEQTFKPDSEELELGSAEGVENVQDGLDKETSKESPEKGIDLGKISEITGREFKDIEEFQKHYKELSSFVGKNPRELEQKAKLYDEKISDSKEELKKAVSTGDNSDIIELRQKIEVMELLKDNADAQSILPTIKSVAKAEGISLKDAYETHLKELHTSKLEAEKRQQEERSSSVESKSRISSDKAGKLNSLVDAVKKTDSDEYKEALVKEFLFRD